MKKCFILIIVFFLVFFNTSFVYAHGGKAEYFVETPKIDDLEEGEADKILEELDNEEENLEGINIKEQTHVPGDFGLWFRDWSERISVLFTFTYTKKIEKQLIYAEKRMKIAKKILEDNTDLDAQKKAEKMIEIAQEYMNKIQKRKDKLSNNTKEKVKKLKNNLATHQLRRDEVMEKIEEKVPEESREKFENLRTQMITKGKKFIEDIDDTELSEKPFEHMYDINRRLNIQYDIIVKYRSKKNELLNNDKIFDKDIKDKIAALWSERKIEFQEVRYEFKENQEYIHLKKGMFDEQYEKRLNKIMAAREILKQKKEKLEKIKTE